MTTQGNSEISPGVARNQPEKLEPPGQALEKGRSEGEREEGRKDGSTSNEEMQKGDSGRRLARKADPTKRGANPCFTQARRKPKKNLG